MASSYNSRSAKASWLIGALIALSLAVVVPIHLNHHFFPDCNTVHAGLRVAHHTVVDQIEVRFESRIARAGRAAAPGRHAAAMRFALAARSVTPLATAAPLRARMLRHLRIAPSDTSDGDPPSSTASLHV